jgi:hypothetical protein
MIRTTAPTGRQQQKEAQEATRDGPPAGESRSRGLEKRHLTRRRQKALSLVF